VHPAPNHDDDADAELARLRAGFPQFRIWREITYGRDRYIARSLHLSTRPHTLVTRDLGELRAVLENTQGTSMAEVTSANPIPVALALLDQRWPATRPWPTP
jgi:hypothetical protein